MSAIILCFNIGVVIFAATRGSGFQNGFAEPFSYASESMPQLSSAIHIVINVLSTILLSASNYTMQVLSSPTRAEIDKAHRAGKWFDVGVLSIHNLKRISWKRMFLCAIMVLSSVPLHLFYNSAAIYIAASNEFRVSFVPLESSEATSISSNSSFTYLPNENWKSAYASTLVRYGDLHLFVDQWASHINRSNDTGIPWTKEDTPANLTWPIETRVTLDRMIYDNMTEWINVTYVAKERNDQGAFPKFARVIHGYGTNVPARDRMQLSLSFLIVVIICNAVKLATMLWVLYVEKSDFIVTLGDGAASFLEYRDPTTEKYCVFSKDAITAEVAHRNARQATLHDLETMPKPDALDQDMLNIQGGSSSDGLKTDHFEELVLNSSGVWHNLRRPYSSALGKDREVGSSFM
ncbi:hypothetical protein N0V90_003444 [Kalmusia sp. IMI 367209]|nr:hypothetical protein N0V90_003444 [Kalmusia sp. IMI 367209]